MITKFVTECKDEKREETKMYHILESHIEEYGERAAIFIAKLIQIIRKHQQEETHFNEGRTWAYGSARYFQKIFPYWSEDKIQRLCKRLVDEGVLLKGNFNKASYDYTHWYAFADEKKFLESSSNLTGELREDPTENDENPTAEFSESAKICRKCAVTIPIGSNNINNIKKNKKNSLTESKKKKKKISLKKVEKPMPEDFVVPEEWIQRAITKYGAKEQFARINAEKFVNYYLETDTKRKDWSRCWNRWILTNKEDPRKAYHFTSSPSQAPTKMALEERPVVEDKPRTGVDKLICDYIKKNFNQGIYESWIIKGGVWFEQSKIDEQLITMHCDSHFSRDWITTNLLPDVEQATDLRIRDVVIFQKASEKKDQKPFVNAITLEARKLAQKHAPSIHEELVTKNILFKETERKGMLMMTNCDAETWDKINQMLGPILQDYADMKISSGRPTIGGR